MIEFFTSHWPLWALLALSAFFSASETALFSLSRERRKSAPARVSRLLARPRELLITVLACNLLVNVFFFSLAAQLYQGDSPQAKLGSALGALVALLVFGEILPKTLALRGSGAVSAMSSLALTPLVVILHPVTVAFSRTLELVTRALGESGGDELAITPENLAEVLSKSAEAGLLESAEADMLSEIVELGGVPTRATRRFIRRLSDTKKIPVFCFVDCDPYGIANIYRTLKVGSGNAAHINRFFCVPQAKFLGVTPQDILDYDLQDATHTLQPVDIKRAKDALKNDPFFKSHKPWIGAINKLLKMGVRAEQQALAKHGLNFVIEEYLPRKLKDKKSFLP